MRGHRGVTLVESMVAISIIGVMTALLLPAVQASRESARRGQCRSQLHQLGVALHAFHNRKGAFPPGYRTQVDPDTRDDLGPGWSWTSYLLPDIEQDAVARQIDMRQPVEAAANATICNMSIAVLVCPSDGTFETNVDVPDYDTGQTICRLATSSYVASVGSVRQTCKLCRDRFDGVFGRNSRVNIAMIKDGTSETMAVGERCHRISRPVWPGVVAHGLIVDLLKQGKVAGGPAYVLGTTFLHGKQEDLEERSVDSVAEIFASDHPDVMNFLFCDGSVRSISVMIDDDAYKALSTRGSQIPAEGIIHESPF